MLFRTRDLLVRQRTQTVNALRGHLAEFGVVAPKGPVHVRRLALVIGDPATDLPEAVRELGGLLLGPLGSPVNLLIREALKKAGLGMSDVKYSEKFKSPSAWIAAFKNKAIDVQAAVEPIVTMLEAQGLARRWKSYKDAVPWFQETYFAASPKFLKEQPDAAKKFLTAFSAGGEGCSRHGRQVDAGAARHAGQMVETARKILERIPGPAYAGYFGSIDRAAIDRQQAIWLKHGAVKKKVDVNAIIDTSYLDAARKMAGVK